MNYSEDFILNTLLYPFFFKENVFVVQYFTCDSQPIKCTNTSWTLQGGNVLGTIFSGGVIHIWCSSVEWLRVSGASVFFFTRELQRPDFFPPLLPVITLFRFHASPVASHFSNSAESRLRSPAASLTTRRRSRLASKRCSTQTLWMSALVTEQMATLLQSINPRVGFTENINVR